jgi:hypothetical protein
MRFHRAMYNFWLFQSVYPCDPESQANALGLSDLDDQEVEAARASRLEYLENYASQDLQEMNSAVQFLLETHASTIYTEGVALPNYSYGWCCSPPAEASVTPLRRYGSGFRARFYTR